MAKNNKKTRESEYDDILVAYHNRSLAECMVLGFRFQDEKYVNGFHYDLMNEHVEYLLFDSMNDGTAVVIISNESEQADRIRAIAEHIGGKEYKPNLKIAINGNNG